MEQLQERLILPNGHARCTGCSAILLNLTDAPILVGTDACVSGIAAKRLPKDFNPDALPDGICPDCEKLHGK